MVHFPNIWIDDVFCSDAIAQLNIEITSLDLSSYFVVAVEVCY
ncbi:MAG: hypothetical protein AAGF83_21155 [Cyanobacteria bacterium P01_G01_bin.67]